MSIQVNRDGTWQQISKQEFLEMVQNRTVRPETEIIFNDKKVIAAKIKGITFPSESAVPPPLPVDNSPAGGLPPSPPSTFPASGQSSFMETEASTSSLPEALPSPINSDMQNSVWESMKRDGMRFLRWVLPILKKGSEKAVEAAKKGTEQAVEATKKAAPHVKAQLDKIPVESMKKQAFQQVDKVPGGHKRLIVVTGVILLLLFGAWWMMPNRKPDKLQEPPVKESFAERDKLPEIEITANVDEKKAEIKEVISQEKKAKSETAEEDTKKLAKQKTEVKTKKGTPPSAVTAIELKNYKGDVNLATFSPDGKKIVTASRDRTARIWDVGSEREIQKFVGHIRDLNMASLSPDGKKIITASDDKTARIWDVDSGGEVQKLEGHTGKVNSASFSPDGKKAVTASDDKTIRIWDVESGETLHEIERHRGAVTAASFTTDGKKIVSAGKDRTARIWDVNSGKELQRFEYKKNYGGMEVFASLSPDEKSLVTVRNHDDSIHIWDVNSGIELKTLGRSRMFPFASASFSPDGRTVIAVIANDPIQVWDTNSWEKLYELDELKGVESASFSPDGKKLAVAMDKTVRILDWASIGDWSSSTKPKPVDPAPNLVFVIPQKNAAHGVPLSGNIIHPSSDPNAVKTLKRITRNILSTSFSPDGKKIITTGADATSAIWDASSGKALLVLASGGLLSDREVLYGSFSPDGKQVVTASSVGIAKVWDANSGQELRKLEGHDGPLYFAVFSPDGTKIVTTGGDKTARLWAVSTGNEIRRLDGHKGAVYSASFSPDGTKIVTGSGDEMIRIWDTKSGKELDVLEAHSDEVYLVAFSPDGKKIVSTSKDRTARIWDADSGKEVQRLKGHNDMVKFASFSSDGKMVVTASMDGTAWIWNVESGKVLHRLEAGQSKFGVLYGGFGLQGDFGIMDDETWEEWNEYVFGSVVSASFSPDGKKILTACQGKTYVQIWDLPTIEKIQIAKQRQRKE